MALRHPVTAPTRAEEDALRSSLPAVLEQLVTARRALVEWNRVRHSAIHAASARLPKTHPFSRAVWELCAGRTWDEVRGHADLICSVVAELLGAEHFRRQVDGVMLPSPSDWFYGRSLCLADTMESGAVAPRPHKRERTRAFSLAELSCFHALGYSMQRFMESVTALPPVATGQAKKRLGQCAARFWRAHACAMRHLTSIPVDHRHTYCLLLCLRRAGVPHELGRGVISYLA